MDIKPERDRPEAYRGVLLPLGMTRECMDEMQTMICDYERETFEGSSAELASMLFAIAIRNRGVLAHQQAQ